MANLVCLVHGEFLSRIRFPAFRIPFQSGDSCSLSCVSVSWTRSDPPSRVAPSLSQRRLCFLLRYYEDSVAIGLSSLRRSPGYTFSARVALRSSVRCLPPQWRLPRTDVLRCLGVVDTVCPGWPNITIRARVPLVTAQLEFGQFSSNHMQLGSPGIV